MIPRHQIIKCCLILFLISFIVIFLYEQEIKTQSVPINSISLKEVATPVTLTVVIAQQKVVNSILFLTLKDATGTMPAVAFKMNSTLDPNQTYRITGRITLYEKKLELIVNSIEPIP